jgi:23S rRNA pseudouridine1911/1915/1917 synthase
LENFVPTRVIVVTRAEAGKPVGALLKAHLGVSWGQARKLVQEKRVRQGPPLCRDVQCRTRAGQKLRVNLPPKSRAEETEPASPIRKQASAPKTPQIPICYIDEHLVVVDKPAGLTTMRHAHEAAEFGARGRKFLPVTAADLLGKALAAKGQGRAIAVHRLDRDTSGLVVFARTAAAARQLGAQFRAHDAGRTYRGLVRGQGRDQTIESWLVADRGDGRRGSGERSATARQAVTHVRVLERLGQFSLVECRLESGRTHQVRIHLGESGTPLCGERIYDRPIHGTPLADASGAQRLMLHAVKLVLVHPATGRQMDFHAPMPKDMADLLAQLRRGRGAR